SFHSEVNSVLPSLLLSLSSPMLRWFTTISLLSSFSIIVYQRIHINNLTEELSSSVATCSFRSKRSISVETNEEEGMEEERSSNSISFPLYAQISKKAMRKLCDEEKRGRKENVERRKNKRMKEKMKRDEETKKIERKKCSQHVSFSSPRLISRRSHWNGCALRDGNTWFVCEFHMGYTMLEYADTSSLSASLPRSLLTLPFPYEGTDGTSINGSLVYSHDHQLVLYNFSTSQTNRLPFNIHGDPIYNGSFSRMDIQSDEHGLWVLYREKGRETLTVSRVSIPSLKLLHTWNLLSIHLTSVIHSFDVEYSILSYVDLSQPQSNQSTISTPPFQLLESRRHSWESEKTSTQPNMILFLILFPSSHVV
ncbi:hypothetical protein PENTCL1PPCAC_22907, partial [Pristionchus entomophagus]